MSNIKSDPILLRDVGSHEIFYTMNKKSEISTAEDRILFRTELCKALNISSETLRRWMKMGKIPTPDIDMSQKKRGWRLSTLHAARIGIL